MPFVGYAVYRSLGPAHVAHLADAGRSPPASAATSASTPRRCAAAIEFGIQPDLFHKRRRAGDDPLYAPFHLSQTIPTMMLAHLTGRRRRRGVLTARRRRVPAAGQPAAAAHQPPTPCPETDADAPAPRKPGAGAGRSSGWRSWPLLDAARPAGPRQRVRRGRPRTTSTSTRYGLSGGADRAEPGTAASGATPLLAGYDFEHGGHPTVGYLVSAVVGTLLIGARRHRPLRRARASSGAALPTGDEPPTPRHRRAHPTP